MDMDRTEHSKGLIAGMAAFGIWGVLPLYLKPLHLLDPVTIIAHRVIWGCLVVMVWLALRGQLGNLFRVFGRPDVLLRLVLSALLISGNWLLFIWAIGNGHVVETSLGYFINPLFNVLVGVMFLSERLNRSQWASVGIAALGVLWLTWLGGRLPWIALVLAASFCAYGLVRKLTPVDAVGGLGVETLLLVPFAAGWLAWAQIYPPTVAAAPLGLGLTLWLGLSGLVTALPLALFAYSARALPYSLVGVLQYLAPTLQLLCGLWVFHEAFPPGRAFGFAIIWAALGIYAADGLLRSRRRQRPAEVSA